MNFVRSGFSGSDFLSGLGVPEWGVAVFIVSSVLYVLFSLVPIIRKIYWALWNGLEDDRSRHVESLRNAIEDYSTDEGSKSQEMVAFWRELLYQEHMSWLTGLTGLRLNSTRRDELKRLIERGVEVGTLKSCSRHIEFEAKEAESGELEEQLVVKIGRLDSAGRWIGLVLIGLGLVVGPGLVVFGVVSLVATDSWHMFWLAFLLGMFYLGMAYFSSLAFRSVLDAPRLKDKVDQIYGRSGTKNDPRAGN